MQSFPIGKKFTPLPQKNFNHKQRERSIISTTPKYPNKNILLHSNYLIWTPKISPNETVIKKKNLAPDTLTKQLPAEHDLYSKETVPKISGVNESLLHKGSRKYLYTGLQSRYKTEVPSIQLSVIQSLELDKERVFEKESVSDQHRNKIRFEVDKDPGSNDHSSESVLLLPSNRSHYRRRNIYQTEGWLIKEQKKKLRSNETAGRVSIGMHAHHDIMQQEHQQHDYQKNQRKGYSKKKTTVGTKKCSLVNTKSCTVTILNELHNDNYTDVQNSSLVSPHNGLLKKSYIIPTLFQSHVSKRSPDSESATDTNKENKKSSLDKKTPSNDNLNGGVLNEESWNDYIDKLFDPEFDSKVASNVSAVVGQTVHLGCRVNNLGTKTVRVFFSYPGI